MERGQYTNGNVNECADDIRLIWTNCKTYNAVYEDILIDQGTADNFLEEQLKPEALEVAAKRSGQKITVNMRNGFDHSYYFIAQFIENHINFHAKYLA
jgi:S-formylglutathione hydrolase FrmB